MRALPLLLLALAACPPPKPPPQPGADCDEACLHLLELDCELGQPTPRGATCFEVCTNAERNVVSWRTACVAAATTCEAAENC